MKTITIKQFFFGLMALCLCPWVSAVGYTYDKLNRLTYVDYGGGKTITYSYDTAGNMLSVVKTSSGTLTAQTVSFGAPPSISVGSTGIVSATASSGLAVTFRDATPSACGMASNGVFGQVVVTGLAPNASCAIGASQAGNGVYAPAPEVLQVFTIAPATLTPPSAPTITSVVAGPGRVTINFTPPTSTGGAAIVSYTATCTAVGKPTKSATGTGSPLVVSGLVGGVSYTCSLTASNGTYTSAASATASTTPARAVDLTPILMLLLD